MKAKDFCDKVFDGTHDTPKPVNKGKLLITSKHIANRCLDTTSAYYISEDDYNNINKRSRVQQYDVLFSMIGTVGNVYIERSKNIDYAIKNMGVFSCGDRDRALWLYYYLQSPKVRMIINSYLSGAVQKFVPLDFLRNLDIPDYSRQCKSIINVLTALDDKIALNKRINDKLEAMAKRLYDYWFVQFDFPDENGRPYKSSGGKMVWNETLKREIPVGWEVKSIDDYCRIFTGKKDVNQSLGEGKYKFFSCAPDHRYSNEMLFDGKAIIISGNGSYTGRTIFVNCAFDLYQRTYAVVQNIDSDNNLEYIYCSVKKFLHTKVSGGTHGSAIPYIVYNDIAKEMLVYSSYVVARFQKIIIPIMGKIVNFETEITHLTTLRDRLLPLLMYGQVEAGGSIS